jgi:CRP-like cAMP-binding protein
MMKDFLNNIHRVNDEILEAYMAQWTVFNAPRKTILTEAGNTERHIYYVIDGTQKAYYLNDGKEYITFFSYAPSFSGVLESFFTQTPSKYFLETITASQFFTSSL